MGIDHDMMLGSLLDDMQVVVVHRLRIVVVTTWDNVAYITRLHGIITVFVHQVEGFLHMTLVVLRAGGCLVVHQQLHTFRVRIVVEHLNVEVGIRRHKVKNVAFPHVCPIFPTNIPSLYKYLVKTILGSEVDIALHILVVSLVRAVRFHLRPVNFIELDAGEVVGIVPVATTHNHLPPDTAILGGMNPRRIVKSARLVEVQNEIA